MSAEQPSAEDARLSLAVAGVVVLLAELTALVGWAVCGWDPVLAALIGAAAGAGALVGLAAAVATIGLGVVAALVVAAAVAGTCAWAADAVGRQG